MTNASNQHPRGAGDLRKDSRAALEALETQDLRRALRTLESPQDVDITIEDRQFVNFSSNDYLGLANDLNNRQRLHEGIERFGAGSGASRLISGTLEPHAILEKKLAEFKNCEAALTFSSGFAAALGVIPAIVGKGDVVIVDKLSHACLIDGARLSQAELRVFAHNDMAQLDKRLGWARDKHPDARVLVLVESVYSMDGDRAPLREIVALCRQYRANLLVDEAHAFGVIGEHGRGLINELGLNADVELQMGTFSKALGLSGGYVCGSRETMDYLVNSARSFIFSTAPPPAIAWALAGTIDFLQGSDGQEQIAALWSNVRQAASILRMPEPESAILPWGRMNEAAALEAAESLRAAGIYAPAIRYPTVGRGQARIRFTLSAGHRANHLQRLQDWVHSFSARMR